MKRRILVVEDDTSLARCSATIWFYEGFDVTLAADGQRALKEHGGVQSGPCAS